MNGLQASEGVRTKAVVEWRGETEARLRITELTADRSGYLNLSVAEARDRDGLLMVMEPFRLAVVHGRAVVWRVPLQPGGEAQKVLDLDEPLLPLAVSPDGGTVLVGRIGSYASDSWEGIPYLYDVKSGNRVVGTGIIDLQARAGFDGRSGEVWFNGPFRVSRLTAEGRVVADYKKKLEALVGGGTILVPRVTGDGRRAAAFRMKNPQDTAADLVIYDGDEQSLKIFSGVGRPYTNPEFGPFISLLEWSPDGRYLLYDRETSQDPEKIALECYVLDSTTGRTQRVGLSCSDGLWSPKGDALWLDGVGVVRPDGEMVLKIEGLSAV